MAKDLFVKRLKGVADNDNLPYVGAIRIDISGNTQLYAVGFTTAKIVGNGHFCSAADFSNDIGTEITNTSGGLIRATTNSEATIIVNGKYTITELASTDNIPGDFNISDFSYMNNMTILTLTGRKLHGNLSSPISDKLTSVNLHDAVINNAILDIKAFSKSKATLVSINADELKLLTGDISAFANCPSLTTLIVYGNYINGDITSLANTTALTTCLFGNNNLEGSLETLLEAWLQKGKTGTVRMSYNDSNITFGNNVQSSFWITDIDVTFTQNGISVVGVSQPSRTANFDGNSWTYNGL